MSANRRLASRDSASAGMPSTLEGAWHDAVARATCGWGSARAAPGRPSVAAAAVAIPSSFCAFSTGCRLEALLGVTSVRAGDDRPTAVQG
jgi:hypothetical protein